MNEFQESLLDTEFETVESILSEELFLYLSSIENEIEQIKQVSDRKSVAKKLGVLNQFNDIWKIYKKKKVKKYSQINFDKEYCTETQYGEIKPKNLQVNISKLLAHYDIKVKYNELKKTMEMILPEEKNMSQDNKLEILEEHVFDKCVHHDFTGLTRDRLSSMLLTFADENKYNPVKEYLEENHKKNINSKGHIDMLCHTLDAESITPDFKKLLIKTWLIQCVASAYSKDGLSSHGVLVLQGEQGIGKTSWFRSIVPNPDWFKDGKDIDVRNKDSKLEALVYWIVELGEIASTVKKDFEQVKAFLTQSKDEMRRAYARNSSLYPRRTVFCGSVNQGAYLQDDTGNRRFWTIPIEACIYKHDIDIDCLWAEAVELFKQGERAYLTRNEQAELAKYNRKHEVQDFCETLLVSNFKWDTKDRFWLRSENIFRELSSPVGITLTKISRTLKKMGVEDLKTGGYVYFAIPRLVFETPKWDYKLKEGDL